MIKKDYYVVLGVPRTATPRAIKRAFRRLAKTHHPDHGGSQESSDFHEIVEAYEVLSDPHKRRRYNERTPPAGRADASVSGGVRVTVRTSVPRVEPLDPYVEPLIPEPPRVESLFARPMAVPRASNRITSFYLRLLLRVSPDLR